MRKQNDRRRARLRDSALQQAVQADLMPTERVTDVADHSGSVVCLQPDVECAFAVFNRAQRDLLRIDRRLKIRREVREPQGACQVDQVSDDGARRRHLTRARTDEHHFAHRAPADEDCVAGAFHRCEKMMKWHQHRMRSYVETTVAAPCKPDHLDSITELVRHCYVEIGDAGDALAVNQARVHEPAKSERCQNGDLVGHVESFDVVYWIGLGESEPLRAGERIVKTLAVLFHCGENVVSGPVQDPCDARYLVCLQSALDRRDQRDAAANRRLEQYGHVVAMSELEDFRSVPGDHFLVGGDNVFAVFDGALDRFVDVLDAARHFDDYLYLGVVDYFVRLVGHPYRRQVDVAPL